MKIIIFDFDGTIADTLDLAIEIARDLIGHPSLGDKSAIEEMMRDSVEDVVRKLNVSRFELPFLLVRGRRQMAKRINEVKPFDGMEEVLARLHDKGYHMIIVSNNSTANIRAFLKNRGLIDYFQKVYGNVGLLNKATMLKRIMARNKFKPGNIIYVGDEATDITAAKAVNIEIAAVSWGFNSVHRLAREEPDYLVNNPSELLKVLSSREKS